MTDVQPFVDQVTLTAQVQMKNLADQSFSEGAASRDQEVADLSRTLQQTASDLEAARKAFNEHMALPAPAGHVVVPPPDPHTVLLGGSYGGADESLYLGRAKVARIFFTGNLPSDIKTVAAFKQAYNDGVRAFIVSWKGSQTATDLQLAMLSWPGDCKFYASYFHEPEDNIADGSLTLANWRSRHTAHAGAIRNMGHVPVTILMAWTLNAKSGRNFMDYAGVGDEGILFDFYMNEAENKVDPEGQVAKMADACKTMGLKFTGTAETGVNMNGTGKALAIDLTRRTRAALFAEPLAVLGTWWSTNEFAFIPETADAWFLGV